MMPYISWWRAVVVIVLALPLFLASGWLFGVWGVLLSSLIGTTVGAATRNWVIRDSFFEAYAPAEMERQIMRVYQDAVKYHR